MTTVDRIMWSAARLIAKVTYTPVLETAIIIQDAEDTFREAINEFRTCEQRERERLRKMNEAGLAKLNYRISKGLQ